MKLASLAIMYKKLIRLQNPCKLEPQILSWLKIVIIERQAVPEFKSAKMNISYPFQIKRFVWYMCHIYFATFNELDKSIMNFVIFNCSEVF